MFPAQENQPDITANFFTWKATPNPLSLTHRPPTTSSDPPPPHYALRTLPPDMHSPPSPQKTKMQ